MRKATRRTHYALVNPVALAIEGATITPSDRLDKLRMIELQAIEAFAHGTATIADWRAMADLSNLAQTMCEMGIGPEVLTAAKDVEAALAEAHSRYLATDSIGTTGSGLQSMRDLYEYHDLQRTSVDRSTYERAIVKTRNRIRSAHPSLKVCLSKPALTERTAA